MLSAVCGAPVTAVSHNDGRPRPDRPRRGPRRHRRRPRRRARWLRSAAPRSTSLETAAPLPRSAGDDGGRGAARGRPRLAREERPRDERVVGGTGRASAAASAPGEERPATTRVVGGSARQSAAASHWAKIDRRLRRVITRWSSPADGGTHARHGWRSGPLRTEPVGRFSNFGGEPARARPIVQPLLPVAVTLGSRLLGPGTLSTTASAGSDVIETTANAGCSGSGSPISYGLDARPGRHRRRGQPR